MIGSLMMRVSVVVLLVGMLMGIVMGIREDFALQPAHAHLNLVPPQRPHAPGSVVGELGGSHGEQALAALLVRRGCAQNERPLRPGVLRRPLQRRRERPAFWLVWNHGIIR